MNDVNIIIVTYNGMKWINECLTSITKCSIHAKIIVIDNNSTDETVNFIKLKFPNVILFEQNKNLGFGQANNIGIAYALKQNAEFIFLLNQDALVDFNSIEELIKVAKENPDYGILSPIQLDGSGNLLEYYFYKFMIDDTSKSFYSDFILNNKKKQIYEIQFIQAAAWLLPINTIKKIGGFDPIFFHYGEDNNYCQRVLFHNLKIGVVPNSFIRHDSNKYVEKSIELFSETYFRDYILRLNVFYANINISFTKSQTKKEKINVLKAVIKSILKLKFYQIIGYYKKYIILNNTTKSILKSREINKQINTSYLDL